MDLAGEILVIIYDGINKTNRQINIVPTLSAKIYPTLKYTGAVVT